MQHILKRCGSFTCQTLRQSFHNRPRSELPYTVRLSLLLLLLKTHLSSYPLHKLLLSSSFLHQIARRLFPPNALDVRLHSETEKRSQFSLQTSLQVRKETIGLQTVRTRKPTTNAIALSLYRLSRSLSFR